MFLYIEKEMLKKLENSKENFINRLAYNDKNKILYGARTIEKNIKIYKIYEKGDKDKLIATINILYFIDNIYYKNGKFNFGIFPNMMEIFKVIVELNKGNGSKNIV